MPMDFSQALLKLKGGTAITRERKGSWHLFLRKYRVEGMQTVHSQIMERSGSFTIGIWKPSQDEIFATDWLVYPLENERNQQ